VVGTLPHALIPGIGPGTGTTLLPPA